MSEHDRHEKDQGTPPGETSSATTGTPIQQGSREAGTTDTNQGVVSQEMTREKRAAMGKKDDVGAASPTPPKSEGPD